MGKTDPENGIIYIISHQSFGENIYKLGFTGNINTKALLQRYRTYYPEDPVIRSTFKVTQAKLAEKLLFHWLRDRRVHPSKEFFKEKYEIILDLCKRVKSVVDLTNDFLNF